MSSWEQIGGSLGRNDRPAALLQAWEWGEFDSIDELAIGIEDAWTAAEFPQHCIPTRGWLSLFKEADYLEDAVRAERPSITLHLYRGATPQRKRGMSWTRDFEKAAWFAARFSDGAYVWEAFVPPDAMLAHFHDSRREDEFVINPRGVGVLLRRS